MKEEMLNEDLSVREYAYIMETLRRFLIDKVLEMEKSDKISKSISDELLSAGSEWFSENYPRLLPSI